MTLPFDTQQFLAVFAAYNVAIWPVGVAPCPTTIFTVGMLILADGKMVPWLAAIPILWAIAGTSAAVLLSVPEDLGLAVAAALLVLDLASRTRQPAHGSDISVLRQISGFR